MSRFLISCGGTGGHLSPGISLAEGLAARGHESLLLVSEKKVDARLLEKYPRLRFERMPGAGFSWQPVRLLRCVVSQARAFRFCWRLLRDVRPAAVVGFGGFTSVPLVLAARLRGVPAAMHESNRVPGLAIRTFGRFAQRVYLPPGILIPGIRAAVTRHCGLPVRREIVRRPQAAARAALGLDANQRLLVILGGSQGSGALNDWIRSEWPAFAAEGIQVYCVMGLSKGTEGAIEGTTKTGQPVRAVFAAFSDQIADLLSAADLVVSRAGAGTLAELIRCETPAILVPYPQAADDHQRANAAFFERQGGGVALEQAQLDRLGAEVREVIFNDGLLRKFRGNLQRMDRASSLDLLLRDIEDIAARAGVADDVRPATA